MNSKVFESFHFPVPNEFDRCRNQSHSINKWWKSLSYCQTITSGKFSFKTINRIYNKLEWNLFENKIKYSKKRKDLDDFQPISAISPNSQKLLKSPRKAIRKIPKSPFKVLDAPDLQDDFYLNLVDWSSTNVLSVGLGSCVYLWSAHTSQVRIKIKSFSCDNFEFRLLDYAT